MFNMLLSFILDTEVFVLFIVCCLWKKRGLWARQRSDWSTHQQQPPEQGRVQGGGHSLFHQQHSQPDSDQPVNGKVARRGKFNSKIIILGIDWK